LMQCETELADSAQGASAFTASESSAIPESAAGPDWDAEPSDHRD
jgi:hypothetical protein